MTSDLQVTAMIADGKIGLDNARHLYPSFAIQFFADEPMLERIYSTQELALVYVAKAKAMIEMDLFDQNQRMREPANSGESQRTAHSVLERLIDHTDIEPRKILKHMGIPNFCITERAQLKVIMRQARAWL